MPPRSDSQTDSSRCYLRLSLIVRGLEPSNSVLMNQNKDLKMTLRPKTGSQEGLHHEAGKAHR